MKTRRPSAGGYKRDSRTLASAELQEYPILNVERKPVGQRRFVGRFNLLVQGRNLRRGLHRLSGAESFS